MRVPTLTLIYDRKGHASRKIAAPVEILIYHERKRKYMSTGIRLHPKEWDSRNCAVSACKEGYKELNKQLRVMVDKINGIIAKMMDDGNFDMNAIPSLMKDEVLQQQTFISYCEERAKVKFHRISAGTQEHYRLFLRFLKDWNTIVSFADVTENNVLKMDKHLKDKGLKDVTKWFYHKMLKFFIHQAMLDGLIKKDPYSRLDFSRGRENGLTRMLTPEEFHRFESCVIPLSKLARVRDVFVFQTYTMMSYSDLAAFRYEDCTKVNGQMVYKNERIKTDKEFVVVLVKPALDILKKYDYKLPIISNVKYNEYLKAAVMYAKIDKPVTTHYARHTGATMLLNEGSVPIHIISKILGHASVRETERTYAKLMDDTIVKTMADYGKKKFG